MTVEEQMIIEHRNGVYVGRIEEKWNIARNLKSEGLDVTLISKTTGLTLDEIESIDVEHNVE